MKSKPDGSIISTRLSISELSDRILDMAKTGVYRQSVFEALNPVATQKHIGMAIAHAKKFGLYSVANLRDPELGTYYQLDVNKYRTLYHALHSSVPLDDDQTLLHTAIALTQTVNVMLATVKTMAIALLVIGIIGVIVNDGQANLSVFAGATSAAGVWLIQRFVARNIVNL